MYEKHPPEDVGSQRGYPAGNMGPVFEEIVLLNVVYETHLKIEFILSNKNI